MDVLIVEDESTTRTVLVEVLRSLGHDVTACGSGEEGWTAFDAGRFQLVLLNWMLPGMTGLDLCRRMREDPRGGDAIILVITGRTEPGALETVLNAGADDYLAKPLDVRRLRVRLQIAEKRVELQLARRAAEREQRRLELTMQRGQKLESLGVLAGGIAHDFNNLLVGILGHTHLAMMAVETDEDVSDHLGKVEAAAVRASDLTKQLLAYSGRGNLQTETVDLNDVAPEMASLLDISRARGAELTYGLCERSLPVLADATQLRQVILNLVTNASDAIGDESGVIRVSTGMTTVGPDIAPDEFFPADIKPGDYAYVEVADTGCGMDPETRPRIFDPFFTTKTDGRGLGLAAAIGIVRSHQGGLQVRSERGHGTNIRVLLPLERRRHAERSGETSPGLELGAWRGSGTVLVIDEEESVRSVASSLLEKLGFEVVCAADGRTGVDRFHASRDRLVAVMLDMSMPGLSGKRVVEEIRTGGDRIPIILCSGLDATEVVRSAAGREPVVFLRKPFGPAELAEAVRTVLGQPATA